MSATHQEAADRVIVLLAAEGCVALSSVDWLKEVSHDDAAWVTLANKSRATTQETRALAQDETGRPYFLVEVLKHAPRSAMQHADASVRLMSLRVETSG